jgi:hypothetical protein
MRSISVDSIYEKSIGGYHNNDQLLYQDILYYSTTNHTFRFSELGNWIVRKNREILSFYDSTSSKKNTPYSKRVHGYRKRIQNKLDDLIRLKLIDIKGTVKAEKNILITPLYSSTKPGHLLILLIKAKDEEITGKKETPTVQHILDIVDFYSKLNDSCSLAFVNRFFKKCNEKGSLIGIIGFFMEAILPRYNITTGRDLLVLFLGLHHPLNWILASPQIFCETLTELDEEAKKLLLYEFKMQIEEYYNQNYLRWDLPALESNTKDSYSDTITVPGKEWQLVRFNNISDHSKVTVPAYCEACKSNRSFLVDIFIYLNEIIGAHRPNQSVMTGGDCSKCANSITTHVMRLPHFIAAWL